MQNKSLLSLTILLVVLFSVLPGAAKEKKGNLELCELKTVAVMGNSEAAVVLRRQVEKRTWLKLEADPTQADAVLEISETRSTKRFPIPTEQITVSGTLIKSGKTLWSDSATFGEGVFRSGAGSAAHLLLSALKKAGNCNE